MPAATKRTKAETVEPEPETPEVPEEEPQAPEVPETDEGDARIDWAAGSTKAVDRSSRSAAAGRSVRAPPGADDAADARVTPSAGTTLALSSYPRPSQPAGPKS